MPASMVRVEVIGFKKVSQGQLGEGLAFFRWGMGDRVAGLPEGTFRGSIDFQMRLPWGWRAHGKALSYGSRLCHRDQRCSDFVASSEVAEIPVRLLPKFWRGQSVFCNCEALEDAVDRGPVLGRHSHLVAGPRISSPSVAVPAELPVKP